MPFKHGRLVVDYRDRVCSPFLRRISDYRYTRRRMNRISSIIRIRSRRMKKMGWAR